MFVPACEQGAFCQVIFILLAGLHYHLMLIIIKKWECASSIVLIFYLKHCALWEHALATDFKAAQYFSSTHFMGYFPVPLNTQLLCEMLFQAFY